MNVRSGSKGDLGRRLDEISFPPRTDIQRPLRHVRFVPEADIRPRGRCRLQYFLTMGFVVGGAPGAGGEIAKVTHAFQPDGLFSAANSP
jgi:hypothetical protein